MFIGTDEYQVTGDDLERMSEAEGPNLDDKLPVQKDVRLKKRPHGKIKPIPQELLDKYAL